VVGETYVNREEIMEEKDNVGRVKGGVGGRDGCIEEEGEVVEE
jgi:hypothetical protein